MVVAGASGAILAAGLSVEVWQGPLAVGSGGVAQWGCPLKVRWVLVGSSQMMAGVILRVPLLRSEKTRVKNVSRSPVQSLHGITLD